MGVELTKHPKFGNQPPYFKDLELKFHQYKKSYRVKSLDPREIVLPGAAAPDLCAGAWHRLLDWDDDFFRFVVKYSLDARKNYADEILTSKKLKEIEQDFYNKPQDSEEFKKAHDFIENFNHEDNVFIIEDFKTESLSIS